MPMAAAYPVALPNTTDDENTLYGHDGLAIEERDEQKPPVVEESAPLPPTTWHGRRCKLWWVILLLLMGIAVGGVGTACLTGNCRKNNNTLGTTIEEHGTSQEEKCSSTEQSPGYSLKLWYLDHTNGGSGKAFQCEDRLCAEKTHVVNHGCGEIPAIRVT